MASPEQASHLLTSSELRTLVTQWLKEDIPSFDYGGSVVGEKQETAILYCKSKVKYEIYWGSPGYELIPLPSMVQRGYLLAVRSFLPFLMPSNAGET
jgi:hypothetical protein